MSNITVKKVSTDVSALQTNLKTLNETIMRTSSRINSLVEEVYGLRTEMQKFKSDVAKDITTLEAMHTEK